MKPLLLILHAVVAVALVTTADPALADDRQLECEKIKAKIRYIQSKMRAGYTRAQGERMEEQLRELRSLRHKACR